MNVPEIDTQQRLLLQRARVVEDAEVEAGLRLKFWPAETCQAAVDVDAADFPTSSIKKSCTTRSIAIRAATFCRPIKPISPMRPTS